MKRFLTILPFVAVVALLITACSTTVKLGGVVVSITDIKSAQPSAKGMQISATVNYANENIMGIGLTEADHKLYLDGSYVGRSLKIEPIGLPQLASASQPVIFQIEKPEVIAKLASSPSAHAVPYKVVSQLRTLSGEDKVEIDTANTGTLDISTLAK